MFPDRQRSHGGGDEWATSKVVLGFFKTFPVLASSARSSSLSSMISLLLNSFRGFLPCFFGFWGSCPSETTCFPFPFLSPIAARCPAPSSSVVLALSAPSSSLSSLIPLLLHFFS